MVSRRRILSQSRDELNFRSHHETEEDDTWYNKDKLYKDHLQEVLDKWDSIDDEIWAKIVVLERNRRVAKAYARAPVLTVNGTEQGFDGFRIGLSGFENPMRDIGTEEALRQINQGFKLKMDDLGNILIKRLTKSPVYAVNTSEENSLDQEIIKLQNGMLEYEKPFKLFDMKKFQQNVNRELKRQYPERRKLERQCISIISFGSNTTTDILDCPIWILCINVVAMEMLRTKIPPSRGGVVLDNRHVGVGAGSSDEDPYSVAGSGSSGSSGNGNTRNRSSSRDCPPQLPPRDNGIYSSGSSGGTPPWQDNGGIQRQKKEKKKTGDDPYYFGLSARIPNFVKSRKKKQKERNRVNAGQFVESPYSSSNNQPTSLPAQPHPFWWHSRIYQDNPGCGVGEGSGFTSKAPTSFVPYVTDSSDSDYSHIYGRLPLVNRGVRKFPTKPLFLSQWE